MSLTWHIVKKDLRRFWAPLVLICIVTAIRFGIGISLLTKTDPDPSWFGHMAIYANVLWGIGLFLTYMLTAAVIQEDSLAGPAFWQTRPISGSRLLAAKAIGLILMFGLLPVLISVPWWLGCGFGLPEICNSGIETLVIQAGVVILALSLAVVTAHYDRFLLWTFVAGVAWMTDATVMLAGQGKAPLDGISTPWAGPTCILAIGLIAVVGCSVVAIHQFVTRKTWRSAVLILVTAFSMAAAGRWWTWDASPIWSLKRAGTTALTKDIRISLDYAYAWPTTNGNGVAQINLFAEPVPSNYVLLPLYSEQNVRWRDGSVSTQKQFNTRWGSVVPSFAWPAHPLLGITPEPRDQSWVQYEIRHNLTPLSFLDPKWNRKTSEPFTFFLSPEMMQKVNGGKPSLDGTYWFRLFEPEVVGEVDINVGNGFAKGPIRSRISAVRNDEEKHVLWISFVESSPEYFWSDFLAKTELTAVSAEPAYCVVDRKRTHASDSLNETKGRALIANVAIVLRKDGFRGPSRWNASKRSWEIGPGGFEKATVAEVNYLDVARFSAPLEADLLDFRPILVSLRDRLEHGSYTVTGEVAKAGTFVFSPRTSLVNALRAAGGVSDRADLSKVTLTRTTSDGASSTVVVDVEAWLEAPTPSPDAIPLLNPGDVVVVPVKQDEPSPQP